MSHIIIQAIENTRCHSCKFSEQECTLYVQRILDIKAFPFQLCVISFSIPHTGWDFQEAAFATCTCAKCRLGIWNGGCTHWRWNTKHLVWVDQTGCGNFKRADFHPVGNANKLRHCGQTCQSVASQAHSFLRLNVLASDMETHARGDCHWPTVWLPKSRGTIRGQLEDHFPLWGSLAIIRGW